MEKVESSRARVDAIETRARAKFKSGVELILYRERVRGVIWGGLIFRIARQ